MKILSYNVNGIRAAVKKNLIDYLREEDADIVCFQELKANPSDIDEGPFSALGYRCFWYSAEKKGYSGVGILSRVIPINIQYGMGHPLFDNEGRTIIAEYSNYIVVNTYFPSGTSGDERQKVKFDFLNFYSQFISDLRKKHKNILVVGDYNIAHTEIDIHNPKGNQKTSGFLPEERQWMTDWFNSGMIDSYRHLHPDTTGSYTWWSARFPNVRKENKGWRIDYISISAELKDKLKSASIVPNAIHSDHCPHYAVLEI